MFDVLAPLEGARERLAHLRARYALDYVFIHINKTGGSSVERALGLPFQHKTALELRSEMGAARWARRFKFTIVRNPWDRAVSHFYYRVQTNQTGLGERPIPFGEWVERVYVQQDPEYYDQPRMFMPQVDWIADAGGRTLVDFVGRFETLERDFAAICGRLRRRATLPHLKSSNRPDYRRAYSDTTAGIVATVFARDIEAFGYAF